MAFLLLRGVRFLVPRSLRARWLAEWQAEIWYRARAGHGGSLPRTLSAIPHAAVLRRQHWSPDVILGDLRYAARQLIKNPGLSVVITLTQLRLDEEPYTIIGVIRLIDAWRPEELRDMVTLRLDPRASGACAAVWSSCR